MKSVLLRISEYCPQCDQLLYMKIFLGEYGHKDILAGVYCDRDGTLCVGGLDDSLMPEYECILCRWIV